MHIINWFIVEKGCKSIKLEDDSNFANKPCKPYTILYQLVNNKVGMYQSVGFKGEPPINTAKIQGFLDKPYKEFIDEARSLQPIPESPSQQTSSSDNKPKDIVEPPIELYNPDDVRLIRCSFKKNGKTRLQKH